MTKYFILGGTCWNRDEQPIKFFCQLLFQDRNFGKISKILHLHQIHWRYQFLTEIFKSTTRPRQLNVEIIVIVGFVVESTRATIHLFYSSDEIVFNLSLFRLSYFTSFQQYYVRISFFNYLILLLHYVYNSIFVYIFMFCSIKLFLKLQYHFIFLQQ